MGRASGGTPVGMGGTTRKPAAPSPMLLPGLAVVRRDETTLQVGLEPGRRARLPDSPQMRRTLASLVPGPVADPDADFTTPAASHALAILAHHRLLVDRGEVAAALTRLPDARTRSGVTALFAQQGPGAGQALRARAESTVSVRVAGRDPIASTWSATLTEQLLASGIGRVESAPQTRTRTHSGTLSGTLSGARAQPPTPLGPDVGVLISLGEPDRDLLNAAMGTGEAHLVVAILDGLARVGPFVLPGHTACLRCVDAHAEEHDDRRGVILDQVTGADEPVATLPAASDPALTAIALAWAARDVVSFVQGDRPATWSATVTLDKTLEIGTRRWLRHPHCGCCWGDLLDVV